MKPTTRKAQPGEYRPRLGDYELLKAAWLNHHPDATPEQYQEAMQRLAAECHI